MTYIAASLRNHTTDCRNSPHPMGNGVERDRL